MKSSYEIKKEMEEDFLVKKEQFKKRMKELEQTENFENQVNEKQNKLRKNFIFISDDYNIYPQETCENYLYNLSKECINNDLNEADEKKLIKEYKEKCLNMIEDDIKTLLEVVKNARETI